MPYQMEDGSKDISCFGLLVIGLCFQISEAEACNQECVQSGMSC